MWSSYSENATHAQSTWEWTTAQLWHLAPHLAIHSLTCSLRPSTELSKNTGSPISRSGGFPATQTSQETNLLIEMRRKWLREITASQTVFQRHSHATKHQLNCRSINQHYSRLLIVNSKRPSLLTSSPQIEANAHRGRTNPTLPSGKFATLIINLPCRHVSALLQLRTGHAPLSHHLARIKKVESPACPRCNANFETVHHYILICPAYRAPR